MVFGDSIYRGILQNITLGGCGRWGDAAMGGDGGAGRGLRVDAAAAAGGGS